MIRLALILAFAAGTRLASGAAITWQTPAVISGDTDVSTAGTLNYAYNFSGSSSTVNGVAFAGTTSTSGPGVNISFSPSFGGNYNGFGSASNPYNALSSAYKVLLGNADFLDGTGASVSITLSNLTSGHSYAVQYWVSDSRSSTRTETLTSTGGNTVTLAYDSTQSAGGVGQYSIGTFTANGTTQSFTVTTTAGNNDVQINAIQVRDITVTKAASGTDLTAGASWTGSVAPASGNIATWTGTSLGTGLTIGSSISWLGISAPSAASDIAITGSGVLTLGSSGIDMSAAANNLSAGNPITLGASQLWIVNSGKTLTASGQVNGVQAGRLLTKSGSGTLTFSGTTDNSSLRAQVSAGTMVLAKTSSSSVHSVGSAGGTDYALTVAGGTAQLGGSGGDQIYDGSAINITAGTFDMNGQNEAFDGLAGAGGNIINNASATTSTLTLGANNSSGSPAFSGVIANGSGAVALNKTGTGTQTLSGVNTYSGATAISAGTLTVGGAGQLNSGSYAGNITNNGTFVYNSSAVQTLSGVISGSGTLKQAGSGTLTLAGVNTYTGPTIMNHNSSVQIPPGSSAGALVLNNTISSTTVTIGNYSTGGTSGNAALQLGLDNPLPPNATLSFDGNNGGPYAYLKLMGRKLTVGNLSVVANDNSGTTSAVICNDGGDGTSAQIGVLTVSNSTSVTYPGRIRDSVNGATSTGYVELIKDGSGTLFLTGPYNSPAVFTKGTVIKAGTLDISGSSGTGFSANAPITNSGGIFNLGALNLASVTALQLTGGGTINGAGSINNNTASYDLQSGTINPALNGSVGINKSTTGTVTLAGTNGFSGAVAVNAGTLALSGSGAISNASSLSIAASATFDVSALSSSTFNLSGSTSLSASGTGTTVGANAAAIKGASGGTVNLGSRPITLTYDGSHPALYISQGTLSLNGNAFTVNIQSPLPVGTYTIIQQASGNVISNGTFTVAGTAISFGNIAAINVNGGSVNLVISSKTNSLAIFGTSVAKGYGSSGANNNVLISGGSYSNAWAALLTTNLLAKTYVITNDSLPGDTSSGGASRFATSVTPQYPHYVLIAYSLGNDSLGGSANPAATVSNFLANVTNMVQQAFNTGAYPLLGLCYARNDIESGGKNSYMQGANLSLNSWNIPGVNFDGAINDGNGGLISGINSGDGIHPNDYGHAELYYTIPPTLFEAITQGKTNRPYLSSATNYARLVQTVGVTAPIVFTPTNTVHSFTMSFRVRGTNSGTVATVRTGGNYATLQITNGQFVYVSPSGGSITAGSINATNGDWHDVALSFRYALTNTWLFVDGTQAGSLVEQYVPDQFILGGPGASGAPATPAVVDFQNWCVYRSAWNFAEALAQSQGSLQQASMEIGAMLDDSSFVSGTPATNRAQSLAAALVNTTGLTPMQTAALPSNLIAQNPSGYTVNLTWTTNSGNSFVIERRLTGTLAWTYLATVPGGTATYTDHVPTAAVAYDYRVAAQDGGLAGNYSNIATVTPGQGVHQTMLIDFGPNNGTDGSITANPDWLGQYWNNVVGTQLTGAINPAYALPNLITTTNSATSIGLNTSATGWSTAGANNGGLLTPSYSLLGNFAVTNATEDYFFTQSSASLAITNLDPTLNYRLRIFGTRDSSNVRIGAYIVTGANGPITNYLQSSGLVWTNNGAAYNGNNNTILSFPGIVPDGGNQIQMTVRTNSTDAYAYLGIMELAANHSPVAQPIVVTATLGQTLSIDVINGTNAPTDADGDAFSVTSVSGLTLGSGIVTTNGGTGFNFVTTAAGTNQFSYTVTDTYAGKTTNTVTVIVAKIATAVSATSSENPSGFHDSVSFTASVQTNGATAGDATGTFQFQADGVVFDTESLSGGAATSLATTALPRGTITITVAYSGDGNHLASTNSLSQVVTNHPPAAGNVSYTRNAGINSLRIPVSDLLAHVTDADGDTITLVGTGASTNGVAVTQVSVSGTPYLYYYNTNNANDQFSYTVTDGFGGTNSGLVSIVVSNAVTGQITGQITSFTGGVANLVFHGIPNYSYVVERSTNITDWVDIQTNTASANTGELNVTDAFGDLGGVPPSSAYYRLKWQP